MLLCCIYAWASLSVIWLFCISNSLTSSRRRTSSLVRCFGRCFLRLRIQMFRYDLQWIKRISFWRGQDVADRFSPIFRWLRVSECHRTFDAVKRVWISRENERDRYRNFWEAKTKKTTSKTTYERRSPSSGRSQRIPKRIIFLSGFASEYAFTFFAIVENK